MFEPKEYPCRVLFSPFFGNVMLGFGCSGISAEGLGHLGGNGRVGVMRYELDVLNFLHGRFSCISSLLVVALSVNRYCYCRANPNSKSNGDLN